VADVFWKKAKVDLCIQVDRAPADPIIWEHVCRVAHLSEAIASAPELAAESIDGTALQVASIYHDAGWVVQVQCGELRPHEIFLRPTSDLLRELGADWTTERLAGVVPPGVLDFAARIIRQVNNRQTNLPEARILTEADNLDEIGPQAVCMMIRKQRAEGKTLSDLVDAWERQEEYHYWEARIKDCFQFASVRKLAEHRLELLRRFMAGLREAVRFEDLNLLNEVAGHQVGKKPVSP
jgi:HD superfamily phosphodiesterase